MKNKDLYASDILDAIGRIKTYTKNRTFDEFQRDTLMQDGIAFNLEIIGEASKRLPKEIKAAVDLPWTDISAMRNKIVHDYFDLDEEVVWRTATEDILELEIKLLPFKPKEGRN